MDRAFSPTEAKSQVQPMMCWCRGGRIHCLVLSGAVRGVALPDLCAKREAIPETDRGQETKPTQMGMGRMCFVGHEFDILTRLIGRPFEFPSQRPFTCRRIYSARASGSFSRGHRPSLLLVWEPQGDPGEERGPGYGSSCIYRLFKCLLVHLQGRTITRNRSSLAIQTRPPRALTTKRRGGVRAVDPQPACQLASLPACMAELP